MHPLPGRSLRFDQAQGRGTLYFNGAACALLESHCESWQIRGAFCGRQVAQHATLQLGWMADASKLPKMLPASHAALHPNCPTAISPEPPDQSNHLEREARLSGAVGCGRARRPSCCVNCDLNSFGQEPPALANCNGGRLRPASIEAMCEKMKPFQNFRPLGGHRNCGIPFVSKRIGARRLVRPPEGTAVPAESPTECHTCWIFTRMAGKGFVVPSPGG